LFEAATGDVRETDLLSGVRGDPGFVGGGVGGFVLVDEVVVVLCSSVHACKFPHIRVHPL